MSKHRQKPREQAAQIAKIAQLQGSRQREAALQLGFVSAAQFDAQVDPLAMLHGFPGSWL